MLLTKHFTLVMKHLVHMRCEASLLHDLNSMTASFSM
jgi:hypothetical protein